MYYTIIVEAPEIDLERQKRGNIKDALKGLDIKRVLLTSASNDISGVIGSMLSTAITEVMAEMIAINIIDTKNKEN